MAQELWSVPHPKSKTPSGFDIHFVYDRENNEWEVECLLNVKQVIDKDTHKSKTQYLVLWKGYPLDYASWEPEEHLTNCQDEIREFWINIRKQVARGKKTGNHT